MKSGTITGLLALLVVAAVITPHSPLLAFLVFVAGAVVMAGLAVRRINAEDRRFKLDERVRYEVLLASALREIKQNAGAATGVDA